jgi:copper chaperone CopZ
MSVETTWLVTGMHCGGCAKRVKGQLQEQVPDLVEANIDPKTGVVRLVTSQTPDEDGIRTAVSNAGYTFVGAGS